jgi:hypothetical protein
VSRRIPNSLWLKVCFAQLIRSETARLLLLRRKMPDCYSALGVGKHPATRIEGKRRVPARKRPMKITTELLVRLAFAFCVFASVSQSGRAQDSAPFTEGSVWQLSFIKIKAGQDHDYLKSLKTSWQALVDEGKKDGYILSSKILYGEAANPEDFQLILMFELKNMAAFDGFRAKQDGQFFLCPAWV